MYKSSINIKEPDMMRVILFLMDKGPPLGKESFEAK